MTTQITKEANPRLPRPDRYSQHVDKILTDKPRGPLPPRLLLVIAVLTLVGAACLVTLHLKSP